MGWLLSFFVTFSPMMLYSRPVNQALAQFTGQKEDWSEPVVTALPLGFVNLY